MFFLAASLRCVFEGGLIAGRLLTLSLVSDISCTPMEKADMCGVSKERAGDHSGGEVKRENYDLLYVDLAMAAPKKIQSNMHTVQHWNYIWLKLKWLMSWKYCYTRSFMINLRGNTASSSFSSMFCWLRRIVGVVGVWSWTLDRGLASLWGRSNGCSEDSVMGEKARWERVNVDDVRGEMEEGEGVGVVQFPKPCVSSSPSSSSSSSPMAINGSNFGKFTANSTLNNTRLHHVRTSQSLSLPLKLPPTQP